MLESTVIYHHSPVGVLEIKNTGIVISSIKFVDDNPISKQAATQNNLVLSNCIQQLDEYFEGKRRSFDFPIEQEGTPFQQTVWTTLQKISFGETISYLDLSKRIGNIKAIRACATANGKNQLAIVIPCHRVIGANGKLVGYNGGLWRKKWLLQHEIKFTAPIKTLF